MPTVNHLPSMPSSAALSEAESLEISPPSSGNQCKNLGAVIRRTRIRGTLSCVSVILFLGICSKEIIWKNLVIEAGSYRALTMCQQCSNCCMHIDLLTTVTTPQGCTNITFILQMRKPRNREVIVFMFMLLECIKAALSPGNLIPQALLLTSILMLPQCAKLANKRKKKKKEEEEEKHMEKEEMEMEEALEKNVKCIVIYDSEHQAQGHSGRDSGIPGARSLI